MAVEFYKEFGPLGYLANYSNHGFTKDGIFYKTVEHYYQSEKFDNLEIKKRIIDALTPKEASSIGRDRNNKRKDNFKDIKNEVMYEGILEKFRQNRDIAYKLIATGNEPIAEATIDEYYWGIGKDKTGKNVIGQIIERVREKIKREILEDIIEKSKECGIVYVIGQKSPDIDSLISSYLLSKVLRGLGVCANFAILGKEYDYSEKDKLIIKDYLKEKPLIINDIKDKKVILVNHNNLEGIDETSVIGAIDSHTVTGEVYNTLSIEYISTSLFIYELFREAFEFSYEDRRLVTLTILLNDNKIRQEELILGLDLDLDTSEFQNNYLKNML